MYVAVIFARPAFSRSVRNCTARDASAHEMHQHTRAPAQTSQAPSSACVDM
jgi:hypothetical protein